MGKMFAGALFGAGITLMMSNPLGFWTILGLACVFLGTILGVKLEKVVPQIMEDDPATSEAGTLSEEEHSVLVHRVEEATAKELKEVLVRETLRIQTKTPPEGSSIKIEILDRIIELLKHFPLTIRNEFWSGFYGGGSSYPWGDLGKGMATMLGHSPRRFSDLNVGPDYEDDVYIAPDDIIWVRDKDGRWEVA